MFNKQLYQATQVNSNGGEYAVRILFLVLFLVLCFYFHDPKQRCCFFAYRNKFVEFDMKPVCKKCYEKFPLELKKRLKKLAETVARK